MGITIDKFHKIAEEWDSGSTVSKHTYIGYGASYDVTYKKLKNKTGRYLYNECYSCVFFDKLDEICTYDTVSTKKAIDTLYEDFISGEMSFQEYNDTKDSWSEYNTEDNPLEYVETDECCYECEPVNYNEERDSQINEDKRIFFATCVDETITELKSENYYPDNKHELGWLRVKKISL